MAAFDETSRVNHNTENVEILVGTYEEFILGYKLTRNPEGGLKLVQSFTNHSHCGSIRCVAVCKRYLATGSTDETIHLFSLKDRVEHGGLHQHNGTIVCLEFFKNSHMFSGSDDGNVCVWNMRTWNCEKTLIAHKGGVTALSIHPSGKLALTVGKDKSMKTWNLIKGRTAYVTNVKGVAEVVKWSPDGTHYAVGINSQVNIYNVESAGIIYSIQFKHKINSVVFLSDTTVVVGGDGPNVEVHSITSKQLVKEFRAHEKRVKSVVPIRLTDNGNLHLVTASNDGLIKLWELKGDDYEASLVTEVNTACRITSMTVWVHHSPVNNIDEKPDISLTTAKPLKPVLKKTTKPSKTEILQTRSGQFYVEPLAKTSCKKPRLSFSDSPELRLCS